jgi:hypothetical protein
MTRKKLTDYELGLLALLIERRVNFWDIIADALEFICYATGLDLDDIIIKHNKKAGFIEFWFYEDDHCGPNEYIICKVSQEKEEAKDSRPDIFIGDPGDHQNFVHNKKD